MSLAIVNKTVLVTGANRGLGRALADDALRRGAKRVLARGRC
jgi:NAD(P)-dependent dehydrogenase (short-subunit alcohol dehydrogenase family)